MSRDFQGGYSLLQASLQVAGHAFMALDLDVTLVVSERRKEGGEPSPARQIFAGSTLGVVAMLAALDEYVAGAKQAALDASSYANVPNPLDVGPHHGGAEIMHLAAGSAVSDIIVPVPPIPEAAPELMSIVRRRPKGMRIVRRTGATSAGDA